MELVGYCLWVSNEARVVSFHPVEGYTLMEFQNQDLFLRCVDEYTHMSYRYQ